MIKDSLFYKKVLFLTCPTGAYCREDRCQSFFQFELVPSMRPPLEECEAGGVLRDLGCDYCIIDAPNLKITNEELLDRVRDFKPDLVVFAVTFGSLKEDLGWAMKLKQILPDSHFCLRGAPSYVGGEEILKEAPFVDFLLHGDYELCFLSLIKNGFKSADGCMYLDPEKRLQINKRPYADDLDTLPFPDRSKIDSSLYTVRGFRKPQATIRVQRGCPFPCTYCLVHTVTGNKARHRSPSSIVAEMKKLLSEGINHFYLRAETFTLDKKWAISVCNAIEESCKGARWVTTTRVECVDEEVIAAMKHAGCYGISFGIDVASEKIGKEVKKPPQIDRAANVMKLCDRFSIVSLAYFMIGFIWETKDTLRETELAVKSVNPDLITIHFAHPYPGTKYEQDVKRAGYEITSLKAQSTPAFQVSALSIKELHSFSRKVLLRHYLNPLRLMKILKKMFSFSLVLLKLHRDSLQDIAA